MAEKTLNTRILMRYDTYENWQKSTLVLKAGEFAVATIPAESGVVQGEPAVLVKVGDGSKVFSALPFISGRAADVYSWAKAEKKPEYTAEEIGGLADYISGEIQDTDTQYKLEQDTNNKHILNFYSKALGAEEWTLAGTITTADTVYDDTAVTGRVTALEGLVGSTKVADQIAAQITALDLANTYEQKGAAASALAEAKTYADGKDTAIAAAQSAADKAQQEVDAAELKISANETAIANVQKAIDDYKTANDKALADEIDRATQAEQANAAAANAAQEAADAAQDDVDALAAKVGTVPENSTVMGIIQNIQENAYDDTEIRGLISGNAGEIATIKGDYLKSADKTALQEQITANDGDIAKNAEDIQAVSGKVETLVGEDTGKSARAIAAEELAKQLIPESAAESLNTLGEIAAWIQAHPGDAATMNQAIQKNAADIATNVAAIANNKTAIEANDAEILQLQQDVDALELLVGVLPEGATATTVVGYVDEAVAALKIGDYAKAADLSALTERVVALEAKAHEHANKALLDTYTQTEANLADAVAKKHAHENADVLAGITAAKVTAWDAAEQNAKTYADGLNTAMDTRMDAAEESIAGLHAIAQSGNVNDLVQTTGDVLIFNCGTSV